VAEPIITRDLAAQQIGWFYVLYDNQGCTIIPAWPSPERFRITSPRASNPILFFQHYTLLFRQLRDGKAGMIPPGLEPYRLDKTGYLS